MSAMHMGQDQPKRFAHRRRSDVQAGNLVNTPIFCCHPCREVLGYIKALYTPEGEHEEFLVATFWNYFQSKPGGPFVYDGGDPGMKHTNQWLLSLRGKGKSPKRMWSIQPGEVIVICRVGHPVVVSASGLEIRPDSY